MRILLFLCTATLLGGCGMFDSSGGLSPMQKDARPGADRTAPVGNALPPPDNARPHESGVAPTDETGGAIGSTLQGKGGQKTQKDETEKQATELIRKEREQRAAREAAANRKAASPAEPSTAPGATPEQPAPESHTPSND